MVDIPLGEGEEKRIKETHELYKDVHKLPPHKLFKALQAQHLLTKIYKLQKERLDSTVLDEKDMFRACHLGYDGLLKQKSIIDEKIKNINPKITVEEYKDIISPLGNFIMGHKVIKNYCPKYLDKKIIDNSQNYYDKMKANIAKLDNIIIEEKEDPISLQRDFGVLQHTRKTPETIYNVEGIPIQSIEQYTLRELAKQFEQKYKGKNAFWRGAKTKAFESFITKKS